MKILATVTRYPTGYFGIDYMGSMFFDSSFDESEIHEKLEQLRIPPNQVKWEERYFDTRFSPNDPMSYKTRKFIPTTTKIMQDIENELNMKNTIESEHRMAMTPQRELIDNLQEWGEHFREMQHGATLTILRARKTILDQSALIHELKDAIKALSASKL